ACGTTPRLYRMMASPILLSNTLFLRATISLRLWLQGRYELASEVLMQNARHQCLIWNTLLSCFDLKAIEIILSNTQRHSPGLFSLPKERLNVAFFRLHVGDFIPLPCLYGPEYLPFLLIECH